LEAALRPNANGELTLVKPLCHSLAPSPRCRSKSFLSGPVSRVYVWSLSRRTSRPAVLRLWC